MKVDATALLAALERALERNSTEYWSVIWELTLAFPEFPWRDVLVDERDKRGE